MNTFKRIFMLLLVCLLAVAVLASCGEKKTDEPKDEHTHKSTSTEWQVDKDNHWKLCDEDGEKVDVKKHDLEDDTCKDCGVHITLQDDQAAELAFYDEYNNWTRLIIYDSEGNVTNEKAEYTYDEKGNMLSMKSYKNDKVTLECEYGINADGYSTEIKTVVYKEDGKKSLSEYNLLGDLIKEVEYKEDGTVEKEHVVEITYNDDGKQLEKHYENEKLVKEVKYIVASRDSWGGKIWNTEETVYNEDGTTTVTLYDENGTAIEG